MLELVGQRILDQLEFDIRQGILIILQLCLDRGQLVAQQAVALGTDPAEVIGQSEGVEPAHVAVVQKLLDLGEIGLGPIGQRTLLLERGGDSPSPELARA